MNKNDALKNLMHDCQTYLAELNEHVDKIVKINHDKHDCESVYVNLKKINYLKIDEAGKICSSQIKILFNQIPKENPKEAFITDGEIKEALYSMQKEIAVF